MRFNPYVVSLMLGTVLSASPAMAQSTPGDDDVADDGAIIVTAQRRAENVMTVPLNVTVVSAETLSDRGVAGLHELTKLTPSLQSTESDNFSVRGVGTASFFGSVEKSVSQAVDEVVIGSHHLSGNGFFDLERVEVLNGPQGLLFGKNASAGLINITTASPKLGEFGGFVEAEGTSRWRPGTDGLGIRMTGAINAPLGDKAALRIAGLYSNQDPLVRQLGTVTGRDDRGLEQIGVRVKLRFEPTEALSINIGGEFFRSQGTAGEFDAPVRSLGSNSQYTATLASLGIVPADNNLLVAANSTSFRDRDSGGLQAKVAYQFDNGMELSNIFAWKTYKLNFQFDSDPVPVNYFDFNFNNSKYNQYSNELRLALPDDGPLSGQMGFYYFKSHLDDNEGRGGNNGFPGFLLPNFPFCVGATVLGAPPAACPRSNALFIGSDAHYIYDVKSIAGFAQFSYKLTEQLKLTAGGRVTGDDVSMDNTENVRNYFVTLGVPNSRIVENKKNTNFSWKLGLDYQATPDLLIYGFYGHGYKGPGFSSTAAPGRTSLAVDPEISKGGEIGLKSSMMDRRLNLSIAAFYTKFDNLQVSAFDSGVRAVLLGNAGKATTKGVDLSLQYRASDDLRFSVAANYTDAKYDTYPGAPCYPTQATASCAVDGTFNASGLPLLLSSKFASSVSADYEPSLGGSLKGILSVVYNHRDKFYTGFAPGNTIPAWDTLDLRIGVKGESWSAALFCQNCTNSFRPIAIDAEPGDSVNRNTLSFTQRVGFNSMRTIGVRLGYNF
ncbi:TonB-dependent receptor [Novosphingobium sp. MW5]|nr:TonB-dependent receptor [Novosphingobium sp. MW5]